MVVFSWLGQKVKDRQTTFKQESSVLKTKTFSTIVSQCTNITFGNNMLRLSALYGNPVKALITESCVRLEANM